MIWFLSTKQKLATVIQTMLVGGGRLTLPCRLLSVERTWRAFAKLKGHLQTGIKNCTQGLERGLSS